MIQSRERIYRLMLLDIQMPEMDGFDVLEYPGKKKLLKDLPVIVISGDASNTAVLHAYGLGARWTISPGPFSPEIVLNRVQNILSLYKHEYQDALTGGYNRCGFIRRVENVLYNVASAKDYVLMFFDIKNFKATNELFGTDGGDGVLKEVPYDRINAIFQPEVSGRLDADHFICLAKRESIDQENLARQAEDQRPAQWPEHEALRLLRYLQSGGGRCQRQRHDRPGQAGGGEHPP